VPPAWRQRAANTWGAGDDNRLARLRATGYDPATMWQAYVRFTSGSTTRADVAENEDDARKALEDAMSQLKSNGIGMVGPSLVVTKDDLEFIKLELKQQDR
jgi:hypothetical protein